MSTRNDSAEHSTRAKSLAATSDVELPQNKWVDNKPASMAHEAIYDVVLGIFRELPAGSVLDIPAGQGTLAQRLTDCDFAVQCGDLYPEIFRLADVEIRHADLNGSLPYESSSFDYVVCIEGLEHIESPPQALREFSRLLKSGGHLIVSVPNILNIEERLKWLFYGYTSHFKPVTRDSVEQARREFGDKVEIGLHINPIGYSELRYLLETNGFEIVSLYRDKRKSRMWLYWPIVSTIRLLRFMTAEQKRRERWSHELQSDEILLGGNTLIIHALKK